MIVKQGMGSGKLRNQVFHNEDGLVMDRMMHERQYSEDTAKLIDDEVELLITEAAKRAETVIKHNIKKLEELKDVLLEKETVEDEEVAKIFEGTTLPKSAALY